MSKRIKFFISHLLLSLLAALCAVILVFGVWYPMPLANATGVTILFLMMLAIDVIVGPVLGWFVYKEGKKTLKFDLAVIIIIQIGALFYGVYTISQGRPVWIVFYQDGFELVRFNEQYIEKKEPIPEVYQNSSWLGPQYVAVVKSENPQQRADDLFAEAFGGISLAQRPARYLPLEDVIPEIKENAKDFADLKLFNNSNDVDKVLKNYPQANAWLPMKANHVDMVVLLDKKTANVIKIVNLRPTN